MMAPVIAQICSQLVSQAVGELRNLNKEAHKTEPQVKAETISSPSSGRGGICSSAAMSWRHPFPWIRLCIIAFPPFEGELLVIQQAQQDGALINPTGLNSCGVDLPSQVYATESRQSQGKAVPHRDTHIISCEAQLLFSSPLWKTIESVCSSVIEKSGLPFLCWQKCQDEPIPAERTPPLLCLSSINALQSENSKFSPTVGGHCNTQRSKTEGQGIQGGIGLQ